MKEKPPIIVKREIFKEIDCHSELRGEGKMGEVHLGAETWQSLKDKWLKKANEG